MREAILKSVDDSIQALDQLRSPNGIQFIQDSARMLSNCFAQGGKVLIAGNGGSLCDASHFAEELTGFFRNSRKPLPAIALSDSGHMSCTANDLGFEMVFSRAIEAYSKPEDIFIGLTTSGNSPNIIKAFEMAEKLGLKTIAFLGKNGGKLKGKASLELIINGFKYSDRIQEAHMTAMHIIIEMVEYSLFNLPYLNKNFLQKILIFLLSHPHQFVKVYFEL